MEMITYEGQIKVDKITIVLQVSNTGTYKERFQGKINGVDVVSYLVHRIKRKPVYEMIMATSKREEDTVFEEIAKREKIKVYRGDYKDVLDRICGSALLSEADHFVRIYANYPLVDLDNMEVLYREHVAGNFDYSYNEHNQGVLWGTGCEVFRTQFILELNRQELNTNQRETFSYYIRQNESRFRVLKKNLCTKRKGYRLCLETEKDLEVIQEVTGNIEKINNESICAYLDTHKILGRYNLDAPAKEVGIEKLFLHPDKMHNLLNREESDFSYPISVELTLTNTCNLRCVYCSDNDLRSRQGKGAELSMETIKALFDDLAAGGTKGITLEGGGEPTLYTEFPEVVSYAKKRGLALGLITNGTVTLDQDILKEFEWIRVSLDASTAEEYAELKGVNCFERVISNIAYYAKYCRTVGVGYVVTNKNISQIEPLVIRVRESGASYIQCRPVVDCEELSVKDSDLSFLKFYQTADFGVIVDGMTENADSGNGDLPCITNSITSVISGDGSVYLCGRLNIYDWVKPIGNINDKNFREIWLGEERLKQSQTVMDAEFCSKYCPQCRVSKFNKLMQRLAQVKSKDFI